MAIRLEGPPLREPMVDKNGNISRHWARWFSNLHIKTGGSEPALPVSLGGTGGTTVVEAVAVQTASSSGSSGGSGSSAVTQQRNFILNSPATPVLGDSADTVCAWDSAFADANYIAYATFDDPANGDVSVGAVTATTITVTLTNKRNRIAAGSADCIGVHA